MASAGRMYTIEIAATAITAACDIVEINPADDKPCIIHGFDLFQTTDLGDAAEEVIGLTWTRGNTTSGSGGSAPTPAPQNLTDTAAGFTCETTNSTQATTTTPTKHNHHGWNVRIPMFMLYSPELRIPVSQGQTRICLRMDAAPADSITVSGCVYVEELG